jgi:predicted RNA-binding protein with TRAM domain
MYQRRNSNSRSFSAPVKVDEELDVTIEAVGERGDGIAKVKGFVLFVANTQKGEHIRIKVTKVLSKVGFAEKIGEAEGPAPEQEQEVNMPDPEPLPEEPAPEDSEDFGSDLKDTY